MKWIAMLCVWMGLLTSGFAVSANGPFEEHLRRSNPTSLRFLQTEEDLKRLGLFSAMFKLVQNNAQNTASIPKTLHLIWLGNTPFPSASIERLKGWVAHHPDWKIKFWTDQQRDLSIEKVEVLLVKDFPLGKLEECYYACDNFGERSAVLRYAILLAEGGVYVDHDTQCLKPLDPLLHSCDFICGMEPLAPSILSSSVYPSPHLLGASPQHPILQAAAKWLQKEWSRLESQYPGTDASHIYNRVLHRAFRALDVGIKSAHNRSGSRDAVFPPDYFSLSDAKSAQFVLHAHEGTWHQNKTEAEMKVEKLLERAITKGNRTFLLAIALTLANICVGAFFFSQHFPKRKRR